MGVSAWTGRIGAVHDSSNDYGMTCCASYWLTTEDGICVSRYVCLPSLPIPNPGDHVEVLIEERSSDLCAYYHVYNGVGPMLVQVRVDA